MGEILCGIGGVDGKLRRKAASSEHLNKLIDASFNDLPELLRRLNGVLRAKSAVTLVFTDSSSPRRPRLLPEAVVTYGEDENVGSELHGFDMSGGHPTPTGFMRYGPAQTAGVRRDWVLDVERTIRQNPLRTPALDKDNLLQSPDSLLQISDVRLVFKQPRPQKTLHFKASGEVGSEGWHCPQLPGDCAHFEFSTDGDPGSDPAKRWGVWAVVLPLSVRPPSRAAIDELASRWTEAYAQATGTPGDPQVERDTWDEARISALCRRHGWELQWMTEDSEGERPTAEPLAGCVPVLREETWLELDPAPPDGYAAEKAVPKLRAYRGDFPGIKGFDSGTLRRKTPITRSI